MRKQRKTYAAEENLAIIRTHMLEGVAVSDSCDDYGLHPTVYYRRQKKFFEGGAAAFAKESSREIGQLKQRLPEAETARPRQGSRR